MWNQVSVKPSPVLLKALGTARLTPPLVFKVMSCGPLLSVNEDTGLRAPPVAASALLNAMEWKSLRWALLQKIPRKQMLGASAIHSAEALASLPVWVVENFHPSLLCRERVYDVPDRVTDAVSVSPGLTGYAEVEMSTDAAGYISYQA